MVQTKQEAIEWMAEEIRYIDQYYGTEDNNDSMKASLTMAIQALNNAERMEWISVRDRLPDDNEYKIVAFSDSEVFIGMYLGDGLWDVDDCPRSIVRYWMPFPDPPKDL